MGNSYRKRTPPSAKTTWAFWTFGRSESSRTGAAKAEKEKRLSVQYKAGDERTDNAFFSASRPPHLEELHIQAQAGLKSLQNQEKQKQTKRAWDHSDTSSLQSRSSAEGDDVSIRSQTLSCTTETTSEDALSIRSEMIQRKGSTFRPHDSFPKSSTKGERRKRERRTTVLGLPTHVQTELGLSNGYDAKKCPGRMGVRVSPSPPVLVNGGKGPENTIHIPTVDGKMEPDAVPEGGARVSLPVLEVEAADSALQGHIDRVYYDDSLLGRKTADKLSPLARPKSLAVPWMTTRPASPDLLSPVMSISPQGTYMSKIIPNAILPPLVDVIVLSRDRVRTLSRCSLSTASPSPSVRSVGRFPALPRSREHSSSSDNWSHSQSTETIVSNTSTLSSHGGSRKGGAGPDGQGPVGHGPEPDQLSTYSSRSGARWVAAKAAPASPNLLGAPPPGNGSGRTSPACSTGSAADGSDSLSVRSDRSSSARSVSLRKMKKAPAPPRRTYSLHQKAQQLEAEGAPKAVVGLPPKPGRRPQREGAELRGPARRGSPSSAGEDDVFSPPLSSQSEPGSLACSPERSPPSPITVAKLHGAEGLALPEAQEVSSKHSSPDRFGRTMSPSSGYSSQSGTPTLHAKSPAAHASPPEKTTTRAQPKKPERVCSLQSPGLSVSSSLTSLSSSASDPAPAEGVALPPAGAPSGPPPGPSKTDRFVIPPHPKVPAPSCLPPTESQPAEPRRGNGTTTASHAPDQTDAEPPGALVKPGQVASPPPSPPPAYHPPPPPAKKAEGNLAPPAVAAPASSGMDAEVPSDSLWPPPPPPVPDAHDLSMADFPPPDEAFFSLPAPGSPSVAVEIPAAAEAPKGTSPPPAEEPLATCKATPAEEDAAPAMSPSFSMMVSCKIQQQSTPNATPLPAPTIERPPPLAPTGRPPSSVPVAPQKAHEPAPATLSPSGPQAPLGHKKPANGLPKEPPPSARGKSNPMPKEDANLPIVTPSLLQMVRLRSVHVDAHGTAAGPGVAQVTAEPNGPDSGADGKPGQPPPPQKPIRKSLSLRVPHTSSKEASSPNPLHHAVRLKASTLSSRDAAGLGVAERKAGHRMTLPAFSATTPTAPLAGEGKDGRASSPLLKSPASTASFIFAKSPKKLVIETPSSPEAQASLKKNLVAELMNVSGQRSLAAPGPPLQGAGKPPAQKPPKVPPPIAKKPSLGPGSLQGPWSPPLPPGAQEPSSPLPATGDRTKSEGSAGARNDDGPASTLETAPQSPPAQDLREETA
ncbi:NHS-like protein 3 isoform X2 [Pogona vitticeps]